MRRRQVGRRLSELEKGVCHVEELGFHQRRFQFDVECTGVADILQGIQPIPVRERAFLEHKRDKDHVSLVRQVHLILA